MELFPATKTGILKKGPLGENLSFADDAQGSLSRLTKNVSSSGTSEKTQEEPVSGQTIRSRGETLQFPAFTNDPAYQARVSFRMYSLQPNQDGNTSKSHVKTLEDNIAPKGTNKFFADDAGAAFGPATINSTLEGDDDEAAEVLERRIDASNAANSRKNLISGGIDGPAQAALASVASKGGGANLGGGTISSKLKNGISALTGSVLDNNATKAGVNVISGGLSFQPVAEASTVDMYFPLTMQYQDTAQYEGPELGATGAIATAQAEAGAGVLASTINSIKEGATSIFDVFRNNSGLGEAAARLGTARLINALGSIGATGIRNALTLQNRVVINPNIRALFRGVALREFTFQFKMIAESAQEAETIRKIVQHFREEMYPDTLSANFANGVSADLGYKFPNAFKITFNYRGSRNKKLPQIKYCYLRSVNHTINPTGGTFKRDGQASEIDLTLAFVEYKTLTKNDIKDGY